MGWVEHAIWWHVYPLGFCGAPIRDAGPSPGRRIRRLLGWLDYAIELGVSGLLLGPVFAAQTHGYDTVDHGRIDPRLGTEEDFDELLAQCRARGMRVVLDGVFSHVGQGHPEFTRVLREGPRSPRAGLFDIDWADEGGPRARVFEGHDALVRLDHGSRETAEYVVGVMDSWLDRGIDGWRLDAAYAVDSSFWVDVLGRVRERHPGAWFLGEVIHGDYVAFVRDATVDTVTQYELWKAIWSSLLDRNFFELDWSLKRHNDFLRHFTPNTFVGNHDVSRIATTLGPEGALVALAILMTVGGIPSVYYGDEQGFTGAKEQRIGGDDAVRPAFPETPAGLAPWGQDIYRAHQDLIGLRRRHPWLADATTETVVLENTRYIYRSRARDDVRAQSGGDVRARSGDDGHVIDVELDIAGAPAVAIRDESGRTLWRLGS